MSRAAIALLLLTACYQPTYSDGEIACGPGDSCPAGMTCAADDRCWRNPPASDASDGVAPDSAAVDPDPIDAGLPDATPVECDDPSDCQTPPSLCLLPGTCDLTTHTCRFDPVDCSGMSDECNVGVCQEGVCIGQPANETTLCGEGRVCPAFGACVDFADVCDPSGVQYRDCVADRCQAGVCSRRTEPESMACSRNTEGASCGSDTQSCGECQWLTECALSANLPCSCTHFACGGGVCSAVQFSCDQTCQRQTDGWFCGFNGFCSGGDCFEVPPCTAPPDGTSELLCLSE